MDPALMERELRRQLVALGEVMLRFDPGPARIHTVRRFDVWEGGGEYNVARAFRRAFGGRAAIVTALVDNPVGRLVEDLMLQAGVDTRHVLWRAHDGVGRACRNGLNFTERGFGPRAGVGCYDRGHTAVSLLAPGDVNWGAVFEAEATRCFHTGGVFAALGEGTPALALEGMRAARSNGVLVSFDLNYRRSLWLTDGRENVDKVRSTLRDLVENADVLFGNAEQFADCLGCPMDSKLDATEAAERSTEWVLNEFPSLRGAFCTTRFASDASSHRWGAYACWDGARVSVPQRSVAVYDRVGGGDAAAAGFLFGILDGRGLAWAAECAVVHGALAMSTPGDHSMVTLPEVELTMASEQVRMLR